MTFLARSEAPTSARISNGHVGKVLLHRLAWLTDDLGYRLPVRQKLDGMKVYGDGQFGF